MNQTIKEKVKAEAEKRFPTKGVHYEFASNNEYRQDDFIEGAEFHSSLNDSKEMLLDFAKELWDRNMVLVSLAAIENQAERFLTQREQSAENK